MPSIYRAGILNYKNHSGKISNSRFSFIDIRNLNHAIHVTRKQPAIPIEPISKRTESSYRVIQKTIPR